MNLIERNAYFSCHFFQIFPVFFASSPNASIFWFIEQYSILSSYMKQIFEIDHDILFIIFSWK